MKYTKGILAAGALALGMTSGAALAQDAGAAAASVEVTAGTEIYGPEGNLVGSVTTITDNVAVVDTGAHQVGLPLDRFGRNADGQATIAVTQAQLNEMAAQSQAEATARLNEVLVAGTAVVDLNGAAIGSVASIEGEEVTVDTEWGAFVLKKENFAPGEGQVTAQVLADQVKSALGGAAAPSAS